MRSLITCSMLIAFSFGCQDSADNAEKEKDSDTTSVMVPPCAIRDTGSATAP